MNPQVDEFMNVAVILAGGLLAATTCVSFAQPEVAQPAADDPALRPANDQPAGDYYDWRKTGRPERPWFHDYDQSLVMNILLAEKSEGGWGCKVSLTFAQALGVIERLDRITSAGPVAVNDGELTLTLLPG
jgi:hypothetical protein